MIGQKGKDWIEWTKEQESFLADCYTKGIQTPQIATLFQSKFNFKLTRDQIISKAKRLRNRGKLKGYLITVPVRNTEFSNTFLPSVQPIAHNEEQVVLNLLKKGPLSVGELSRQIDRSKETVVKLLETLHTKGYDVNIDEARKQVVLERAAVSKFKPLEVKQLYRNQVKFGVLGDTQIGSKYQQLSLLHTCFKIFDKEGVDFAIHTGDVVDGTSMYRGHEYELFLHGADEQRDYTIEHFPKLAKGKKCYIISGNHDISFKKISGYNIVREICSKRQDLIYRGDEYASFMVKGLNIDVMHPSGGICYSRSYRPQRIVENLIGEAIAILRDKFTGLDSTRTVQLPHCIFFGHYHVSNYIPGYMAVENFMVPCLQSMTPYLKRKGLAPELGCLVLTVALDSQGNVTKILPDFRKMNAYVKENDY